MPYNPKKEIYVTGKHIVEMEVMSTNTLERFLSRNPVKREMTGYPLFKFMRALQEDRATALQGLADENRRRRSAQGRKLTDPESDLQRAKQIEEIQKLRIANQQKMGTLIGRDRARNRVLTLLNAFATKLRYTIKNTSAQVAGLHDARQIEKILTQNYNDVVDMLEREAQILSWSEDETGSQLGRTKLPQDSGEDSGSRGSEENEAPAQE